ncbi:HD domain-containing protein [Chlorobaculum limnaeum]|nr:HD domain-containing protein [Chlorobaculum limnaeum]
MMQSGLEEISMVDVLVDPWLRVVGRDFEGYRNHCRRVFIFACELVEAEGESRQKIAIASAYHDLGIWADKTFDYLEPSKRLARAYLESTGKVGWTDEIETMIDQHHKVTPWSCNPGWFVEPFRQADWIDVTLGARNFGLPRRFILEIQRRYPNAGFHLALVRLTIGRLKEHPKDPLPMVRW